MTTDALSLFNPLVAGWFRQRYGVPTPIQAQAWPAIARGDHLLITAPTGSGKTMAAFLWALDQWIDGHWKTGRAHVLYVSPLKALNNDIQRNLISPLEELKAIFGDARRPFPEIRVLTRSGDTPASERRRMVRRPPEILITTPESLHLLLSSNSGRSILGHIRTVVLDEIHAVLPTRRGTLLMGAVERMVRLSGEFQRIALSATIRPLEAAARFVGGFQIVAGTSGRPDFRPRPVCVLAPAAVKHYDIAVRVPGTPESPRDPNDFWTAFAEAISVRLQANRATLVFTNSRRLCEKLTFLINRDRESLLAYAHHGSLSREIRAEVERSLKAGALKAILATGSLELGIDIGELDEVILVQAPWSVSEAVQRIGRAGHGVGQVSRGTFLAAHPDDKICAAVIARAVTDGDIEPLLPLKAPLDVLAQLLLSILAFEAWHPDELFDFIRTCGPYHQLSRHQFDLVLDMLEGRYGRTRIRELQPRISQDRLEPNIQARPGALLSLYSSGGVIPDRGYYALRHAHTGAKIGELDEEFVWEARIGQVFTLGAQNWRIRTITASEVRVLPAAPGNPAPPFWRAEAFQRDFHVSEKILYFLENAETHLQDPAFETELIERYAMDRAAARALIEDLHHQRTHTGAPLPHRHHLLIEETALGAGRAAGRQVICHTLWGGRINRPLAVALEAAWEDRLGAAPQIFCTNDTLSFLLPPDFPAENLFDAVRPDTFETLLCRRLPQTGFFGARFRECAGRALLIPRNRVNQRMPLWLTRLRAQKLLAAVAGHTDFPILVETWRTCLQDEFDLPGLRRLLLELDAGAIARSHVHTDYPSPMARSAVWQQVNLHMYENDQPAPGHGGRLTADLLHEVTMEPGLRPTLDPAVATRFEAKRQRLAPGYAPDSPEELLAWLKERIALPWPEWQALLDASQRDHSMDSEILTNSLAEKITILQSAEKRSPKIVVAREQLEDLRKGLLCRINPAPKAWLLDGRIMPMGAGKQKQQRDMDHSLSLAAEQLGRWLQFYGPRPPAFVVQALGLRMTVLNEMIAELADKEVIVAGPLLKDSEGPEICDRENFEILLRLARRSAQPVVEALPLEHLALFIAHHQGLLRPGIGSDILAQRLDQLLGWAAPAGHWETEILPARLRDYQPDWLDALMQAHELRWIGGNGQKVLFCFEDELDLIQEEKSAGGTRADRTAITDELWIEPAKVFPNSAGRYPFATLEDMTDLNSSALNERLWQWVWQGLVSNDAFAALRRGVNNHFKMSEPPEAPKSGPRPSPGRSRFQRWRGSRPSVGNWFQLPWPAAPQDLIEREERNKDRVRLLLDRYGILFRELLVSELPMLRWAAIFRSLRLMELSGEIVAGHFFEGIDGLQFITVTALQGLSNAPPEDRVFWMNALDPASLCGLDLAGLKGKLPRRLPGVHIVYHGCRPVIFSHGRGNRLEIMVAPDHHRIGDYFGFLEHLLTRWVMPLRSVRIKHINGTHAAAQKGYVDVLKQMFETIVDNKEVTLYRRHGI